MLSARLVSSVARQLPKNVPKVARRSLPAVQAAIRQLHVSPSVKAAEISSILEERILGAAPKVWLNFYCCIIVSFMLHN